jgi:hypothetical protein
MKDTFEELVPENLSKEQFWMRYFFLISEIELAHKARSLIMDNKVEIEDDVLWSSDEEECLNTDPEKNTEICTDKTDSAENNEPLENKDKISDKDPSDLKSTQS